MKLLKQITSIALTTAIVLGFGSAIYAAPSGYNINETFPDQSLNKIMRQYDSNSNGYLDSNEISKAGTKYDSYAANARILNIEDSGVRSLDGLEIFPSNFVLSVKNCNIKMLDVSCCNFEYVMANNCPQLLTVVCGTKQKILDVQYCSNLKKTYFNLACNLKSVTFNYCSALTGAIYLDTCSNLERFSSKYTNITEVYFHPKAEVKSFYTYDCPLDFLDIKGAKVSTMENFIVITNGRAATSISCTGDLYYFLWNHRRPDGRGYAYNTDGSIKGEICLNIYWG